MWYGDTYTPPMKIGDVRTIKHAHKDILIEKRDYQWYSMSVIDHAMQGVSNHGSFLGRTELAHHLKRRFGVEWSDGPRYGSQVRHW